MISVCLDVMLILLYGWLSKSRTSRRLDKLRELRRAFLCSPLSYALSFVPSLARRSRRDRGSGGQNYTGIESGENATSGIGLVEITILQREPLAGVDLISIGKPRAPGVPDLPEAASEVSMLLTGPVAVFCFR